MGTAACRNGERGSIAPVFLVAVSMLLIMGWTMTGVAATHFLQAAHESQDILAGQLAKAGLDAAMAEIDEIKEDDPSSLPPPTLSGSEATGQYQVTITPTGRGTYTVVSTGTARNRVKQITAEVAPAPEPFALLSGGNVDITHNAAVSLGGFNVEGDINAGHDVDLHASSVAASVSGMNIKGDVRAGNDANLSASAILLAHVRMDIAGELSSGRDVTFDTLGILGVGSIDVHGPVSYVRNLNGRNETGVDLYGGYRKVSGVTITPPREANVAEFEARVRELERQGKLETVRPSGACGTVETNLRVDGDLKCTKLKVASGAFVVVDGSLDVDSATVEGTLYVRGGPTPNPYGDVKIQALALLELIGRFDPMKGSGVIVATGNVDVGKSGLARALSVVSGQKAVLQVMAVSTGGDDNRNDIDFGLGAVLAAIDWSKAAPLFLYAAKDGNITISIFNGISLLDFAPQPLVAVAGGDITVESAGIAEVASAYTIKAWPEIWKLVPPSLQGLGRARVLTWEWTDA